MINHIDNNTNYKISNNFNDMVMSKMMTTMTKKLITKIMIAMMIIVTGVFINI